MPTTVSVFVVIDPSRSAPVRIDGQSLAECPNSRHAKQVICAHRSAMRFNRRASVDAALSTTIAEAKWRGRHHHQYDQYCFFFFLKTRTFGTSGLSPSL